MRQIGREDDLETINRAALKIAREVSEEKGTLFAGGVSNTNIYRKGETEDEIRSMFDEQVQWSKEEGVDYIIGETFSIQAEAKIALEVIKSHGLPAVITFSVPNSEPGDVYRTLDGVPMGMACKELLDLGATLVGVNCRRGPETILDVVKEIIKECPPEKVCAIPLGYRTTKECPTWHDYTDKEVPANNPVYPHGIERFCVSKAEIKAFTEECLELGLRYLGICCGNSGELTRTMAEAMGRRPPASRYHDPTSLGMSTTKLLEDGKIKL